MLTYMATGVIAIIIAIALVGLLLLREKINQTKNKTQFSFFFNFYYYNVRWFLFFQSFNVVTPCFFQKQNSFATGKW